MAPDQTVHIVDDDPSVCESISTVLRHQQSRFRCYHTARAVLSSLDVSRSGCVVLDLVLPDMSGTDLWRQLVRRGCQMPFLMLSGHGRISSAKEALWLGAVDFLEKPLNIELFIRRVNEALRLDEKHREERATMDGVRASMQSLTRREREVLDHVVAGRLTKQIASLLDIAVKTVESHRCNIARKLGCRNTAQLVRTVTLYEHAAHHTPKQPHYSLAAAVGRVNAIVSPGSESADALI